MYKPDRELLIEADVGIEIERYTVVTPGSATVYVSLS
jgi:hypothetical protein